ncbi:hypothetical protein JCM3765_006119 [Sporobolomyces pararoseus]
MVEVPSFRTSRLVFRALESPLDDPSILDLFGSDEAGQFGWTDEPFIPWSKKNIEDFYKAMEKATIAVMICLPDEEDGKKAGKSIGMMALHPIRYPHRRADFGISLHRDFQGKGFAKEAINWLLERAFVGFGLNRVQGACVSFNDRALKSYKSLGFVEEGRRRKSAWIQGNFHEDVLIGILATEWFSFRNSQVDVATNK